MTWLADVYLILYQMSYNGAVARFLHHANAYRPSNAIQRGAFAGRLPLVSRLLLRYNAFILNVTSLVAPGIESDAGAVALLVLASTLLGEL